MNHRNHLIGHLQAFRAGSRHWDSAEAQRGLDEVMAAVDRLVAAELADMTSDRDKYKAFAQWLGSLCVEHGILKDLKDQPGDTVKINLLSQAAQPNFGVWIDITKGHPPAGSPVLVKWRSGGITAASVHKPSAGELIDIDTHGVTGHDREWMWSDRRDPYEGVTHWMPMPDGPQEQPR